MAEGLVRVFIVVPTVRVEPTWGHPHMFCRHFADQLPVTGWYCPVPARRQTHHFSYEMGLDGMRSDNEINATQNSKTSGRGFECCRSCQFAKLNLGLMAPVLFLDSHFADIF